MNYFELFGIPVAPEVDRAGLARKYFELQKTHHPDYFTQGTEREQSNALEHSAAINKGFQIFQDADKTLAYFLEIKGILIPGEKYQLSADFLMEIMELNESLEAEGPDAVEQVLEQEEEKLKAFCAEALARVQAGNGNPADLQVLKEAHYRKKYLQRILDRLGD